MTVYFFDSSAVVKRYVNETGSDYVEKLTSSKNKNTVFVTRITQVEVTAAFARRLKTGSVIQSDVDNAVRLFHHDLRNNYFVVEITKDILDKATGLAAKHALRGYDAVQLGAAVEIFNERINRDLSPLVLVSADIELNDAARSEGLTVEDPNDFP